MPDPDDDDLATARGCTIGIALGLVIWTLIFAAVWAVRTYG